jgi:hypothetical protein
LRCDNLRLDRARYNLNRERGCEVVMTEAKAGLIAVAAIIVVFAVAMRAVGALRTASAITAGVVTIAIAAALFITQ